jgi:hypothetical protein
VTVIEIKPHRWGWKVFEALGVEPMFPEKRQAIDYAETRACCRSGEIRVLDAHGQVRTNHRVQRGESEPAIAQAIKL